MTLKQPSPLFPSLSILHLAVGLSKSLALLAQRWIFRFAQTGAGKLADALLPMWVRWERHNIITQNLRSQCTSCTIRVEVAERKRVGERHRGDSQITFSSLRKKNCILYSLSGKASNVSFLCISSKQLIIQYVFTRKMGALCVVTRESQVVFHPFICLIVLLG